MLLTLSVSVLQMHDKKVIGGVSLLYLGLDMSLQYDGHRPLLAPHRGHFHLFVSVIAVCWWAAVVHNNTAAHVFVACVGVTLLLVMNMLVCMGLVNGVQLRLLAAR